MDRQPLTDRLGDRLLAEYGGAAAAYSLRALNGNGDSVVRVRRASDNDEQDFTASQVSSGELTNWVNSQIVPPLDIGVETSEGRIPVPEGGTSIGTPAAAYSLRNLSTTYTGNVVDVRRSSDDAVASFTAAEVADGTLEAWVSEAATQHIQFDGVDDFVQSTTVPDIASSTVTITLKYTANEAQFIELQSAGAFHLVGTLNSTLNGSNDLVVASDNSDNPLNGATFRYNNGLTVGEVITIVLNIDATYQITSATVNGASMTTAGSGSSRQEISSKTTLRFGRRTTGSFAYAGYFTNFSVSTDSTYDWDGTEAGAISNGWTVGGSPISPLLNDGFVTKWYDQSGNDNHATQGTDASQPKIVEGGSLVSGGIDFDGVDDGLAVSGQVLTSSSLYAASVMQHATGVSTPDGQTIFGQYQASTSGRFRLFASSSSTYSFFVEATDPLGWAGTGAIGTSRTLISVNGDGSNAEIWRDGTSKGTDTYSGFTPATVNFTIGIDSDGNREFNGKIAEIIIYPSDQYDNRTAIEANIGETYGITGIPAYDNTVDGFVETWYDQSGNGNHATQSVTGDQPKIVDGGVLVANDEGNPAIQGANGKSFNLSAITGLEDLSIFFVGTVPSYFQTITGWSTDLHVIRFGPGQWDFVANSIDAGNMNWNSALTVGDTVLLNFTRSSGTVTGYANSVASDTTSNANSNPFGLNRIFKRSSTNHYRGKAAELILYSSDQSADRVAIETNINNHYDIYP